MELISAAVCLPIDQPAIPQGGIVVAEGKILAVGSADELQRTYPKAQRLGFPQHVLMPGLVNAHLHCDLSQFQAASLTNPVPSDTSAHLHWLRQAIEYRLTAHLEPVQEAIRFVTERLPSFGVTTVGAWTSFDAAVPLLAGRGLRAVVFPEIYAGSAAEQTQDRFESALALLEKYAHHSDRVRIGLAPLAPYLAARQVLTVAGQHALSEHLPLQIHAAESFEEMEFFFNSSGPIGTQIFPLFGWGPAAGQELPPPFRKTPIQYLDEIGFLTSAPTIVGAVQLGRDDIATLKRRRCRVVYAPQAIRHFHLGEFHYGRLSEAGIPVGLGTESLSTPADGDLWNEMRAALAAGGIAAETVLRMATLGGAQALQWEDTTGSLTAGKSADYLLVEQPAQATTADTVVESMIRFTTPRQVHRTVVQGTVLHSHD